VRRLILFAAVSAFVSSNLCAGAGAVTLEPVGKFKQPISIASDPSDAERLLVAEREGVVDEVAGAW
jgi:hypothetical protein